MQFFEKARSLPIIRAVNTFVNSKYMLIVLALLTVLANVFALELLAYIVVSLLGLYLCLFGKDMLVLAPVFIFVYISPSVSNHPFMNENSIFFPENGLWIMLLVLVLFFVFFFLRIGTDGGFIRFFTAKRKFLLGFLILGASFFLGGLGYEGDEGNNLRYSLLLFVALFLLYFILTATVNWKDVPKDYFAWMGLFNGITVGIELIGVYILHAEKIFVDGGIIRNYVYTGWGTYTSMSIVLLISMPCAFYLAATKKFGFIFNILGNLLYLAVLATNCRGSMLFGAFIYLVCLLLTLKNKKNRKGNLLVYGVVLVAAVSVLIWQWQKVLDTVDKFIKLGDSNRFGLFQDGINRFLENPVFGQGFFACPNQYYNPTGANFLPSFWHNTFIQMLAACGIVGLAAYLFHRYQTLKLFIKNPTFAKTFIGICVAAILLTCLLDCHIFNVGVSFIYSILLAFAEKEEEMEKESEEDMFIMLFRKRKEEKGTIN